MKTKKRLESRAIIFGILILLAFRNIITEYMKSDFLSKFFIVTGSLLLILILSILIEHHIFLKTLKSTEDIKWINRSSSLISTSRIISIVTLTGVIWGFISLLLHEYTSLCISCFMIINLHLLTLNNGKILIGDNIVIINGFATLIDKINEFEIQNNDYITLKILVEETSIGFRFKKDEENIEALKELQKKIGSEGKQFKI